MDSLVAKADAIQPLHKRRKLGHGSKDLKKKPDKTAQSISRTTGLPRTLQPDPHEPVPSTSQNAHIANKKLRNKLNRQSAQTLRAKALVQDTELLLTGDAGKIEAEGDLERTWRIGQDEIVNEAGMDVAKSQTEWKLDGGPYRCRYTRNGRHLAIVGSKGHAATFDWQTGKLHSELQLMETCRDITFLHDQSHYAIAQKKYLFIYDKDGVELHRMKQHIEPTHLEYLPYHWLLASVGKSGHLKYTDTSIGTVVATHAPNSLGSASSMSQNSHNAVIHTGHTTGVVALWTPNLSKPAIQLLSHLGPVTSISVDPSKGGMRMATSGRDGLIKVWDLRNLGRGAIREWRDRHCSNGQTVLTFSAKGSLAVASGGTVNVYSAPAITTPFPNVNSPPPLYITSPLAHSRPLTSVRFAPYQDVLTVGHGNGVSNLLVPGSGEPNFDSAEADPFENAKTRREREVKNLLDKIPSSMITLDQDVVGSIRAPNVDLEKVDLAKTPFARLKREERLKVQGKLDESGVAAGDVEGESDEDVEGDEGARYPSKAEKEKKKMRGKGKTLKRYLRKQRKNVIDPRTVAIREKLEKQRTEREKERKAAAGQSTEEGERKGGALDRFRRKP